MKTPRFLLLVTSTLAVAVLAQDKHPQHPDSGSDGGFGRVHMDISCRPAVTGEFDRALALLHNFCYVRALERFNLVLKNDPGCAMAYCGAAVLGTEALVKSFRFGEGFLQLSKHPDGTQNPEAPVIRRRKLTLSPGFVN